MTHAEQDTQPDAEAVVDVVVVGTGPGGEALAGRLAEAGLQVVAVESRLVGGECPYYGCIPSKMIIRAGNTLAEAGRVGELAGTSSSTPDYRVVADRIRDEATADWDDTAAVDRLTGKGATVVRGRGRFVAVDTVEVDGRRFTARRAVVLNTGTSPAVPPIPGLADTPYWTNRDILRTREAPASLAVIGGGAIGVELAQAFSRFGSTVTVIEGAPRLLSLEEPEAGDLLAAVFAREGIGVHTGASARSVTHDGSSFTVALDDGEVTAERLLIAAGRRNNLADLGLEAIGLDPAARALDPDEHMRVAPGVYAIGDITGKGAFTHMSMYQADVAARHILGEQGVGAEYHAVPRVTFTDPEIGAVGMTEKQAREAGLAVRTAIGSVADSSRGWIHGPGNDGFLKVIMDADRGVLIGATSAGPVGGEVLSLLALAVHAAVPVSRIRQMIFAYPTFHRGIETVLADLD